MISSQSRKLDRLQSEEIEVTILLRVDILARNEELLNTSQLFKVLQCYCLILMT